MIALLAAMAIASTPAEVCAIELEHDGVVGCWVPVARRQRERELRQLYEQAGALRRAEVAELRQAIARLTVTSSLSKARAEIADRWALDLRARLVDSESARVVAEERVPSLGMVVMTHALSGLLGALAGRLTCGGGAGGTVVVASP